MCGNRIAMVSGTSAELLIRLEQTAPFGATASFAAGALPTTRGSCAARFAMGSSQRSATATEASALPEVESSQGASGVREVTKGVARDAPDRRNRVSAASARIFSNGYGRELPALDRAGVGWFQSSMLAG